MRPAGSSRSTRSAFDQGAESFPQVKATLTVSAYVFGDGTTPPVPGGLAPSGTAPTSPAIENTQPVSVRACRRDGGGSMSRESVKSLAEKRVRRQKIFIAVGSVVLLAVLGFELPKMMGGKEGSEAVAPTTVPAIARRRCAGRAGRQAPNTDQVVVQRDSNQLISFGLFKSKDPFVQQLSTNPAGAEQPPTAALRPRGGPAATTPSSYPAGTPSSPTPAVVPPGVVVTPTQTPAIGRLADRPARRRHATPPAAAVPAPTEALIATNGVCERVSVAGTFPTDENIFRLVAIAKNGKSVEVGIVGGSFDNGHPTATLKLGREDHARQHGRRYAIRDRAQDELQPGDAVRGSHDHAAQHDHPRCAGADHDHPRRHGPGHDHDHGDDADRDRLAGHDDAHGVARRWPRTPTRRSTPRASS